MSDEPNANREEKAADALITGTLHSWSPKEVSEAELNEFLTNKVELSESEKAALNRVHEQFRAGATKPKETEEFAAAESMESPYMAMNRENAKDEIPAEAREELERKRAVLLANLKAKKRASE